MFCIKCGQELPNDSLFCSKCGEKVDRMSAQFIQDSAPRHSDKSVMIIVLNVVSTIATIAGIIISLFFAYIHIEMKFHFLSYKSDDLKISLFSMYQFLETVMDILGDSSSEYLLLFQIVFVICIVDVIFAIIILIIRLTRFKVKRYNSFLSYVPIAAPVLSLIGVIVFNTSKTFEMFIAIYPISMILSLVLFVTNVVICEIGLNINWEMSTKEKKMSLSNIKVESEIDLEKLKEKTWDCIRCGWENKDGDKYCRNCGKKP